ncbi:MAG: rhodanese-like domain-containing protein [Bacteroidetes bacterium]|nr:rhodanese-like domain-containing protein [Bacteroidota bacterium]MBS1630547.1 rhodanese-like domain-containing protein [Bacteroidota bacterium]
MQDISAAELKARLDAGEHLHILDVREPDEFDENNIGGLLIPLGQVMNMEIDEIEDWKNEEVIVHCRSGRRSVQACLMLETIGFCKVTNLKGGIKAWVELNTGK